MVMMMVNELEREIGYDLEEWTRMITELSDKEVELKKLKDEYATKEFDIVFMSDIDFKSLYGSTSEKVRKQHASNELKALKCRIDDLEFCVNYLTRRIVFLKELIRTKRVLLEVRE